VDDARKFDVQHDKSNNNNNNIYKKYTATSITSVSSLVSINISNCAANKYQTNKD
jgi:hypothetical protein